MIVESPQPRPDRRRVAAVVVGLAIALFWMAASYGITSPFYFGHYGYHGGSYATWARGTLRHHTIYPVNMPGFGPPAPRSYYIHHPVLPHEFVTLTFLLFGEHEWSVRLAALIPSFASLLLLTALAWRDLGPVAGAVAALLFAIVPVNVWYAVNMDQGFPSIACLLAFFFFYRRWLVAPTDDGTAWRAGLAALTFEALAGGFEWSPYFAFPAIFAHVIWTAARRRGRFVSFAYLHPLTVIVPLATHVFLVWRIKMLDDWLMAFRGRSATLLYRTFLQAMGNYGLTLFGPLLLVAMALWAVLALVRMVRGRSRPLDLVGLTFAFALVVYMHVFKIAVQTHAYRQIYGNVWAAVAVADLAAMAHGAFRRPSFEGVSRAWRRRAWAGLGAVAGAAGIVLVIAATAKLSWAALFESRAHGGIPGWKTFDPDLRQTAFASAVERATHPGDVLYFHRGFPGPPPHRMDWAFYYDRDMTRDVGLQTMLHLSPAQQSHAVALLSVGGVGPADLSALATLANAHPFVRIDDLAFIDLRTPGRRFLAYRTAPADRTGEGRLRQWLEGPYPMPRLVRSVEAEAADAKWVGRLSEPPRPR